MNQPRLVRHGLAALLLSIALPSFAAMPTNPSSDPDFHRLPSGQDLRNISVSGSRLSLARGSGGTFSSRAQAQYEKLKNDSKSMPGHPVQWVFMDLDAHRVIDQSLENNRKIFGASSSKIFVGATLLDRQNGEISKSQLQLMSEMLVVSSNTAWVNLQRQAGAGNDDRGRTAVLEFTQRMGYERTRGFQGYLGKLHGNELTAHETAEMLHDTYKGLYPGAETLWKLMHACRTGGSRGRKYIPNSIFVGAKTGTFDGSTVDPESGGPMTAHIRNHVMVFNIANREFGLVVLANSGSDESAALLAGGLIREHAGISP